MKYQVTIGGRTLVVDVAGTGVTVDGQPHQAELSAIAGTPLRLFRLDGRSSVLPIHPIDRTSWEIQDGGEVFRAEVLDERAAHIRSLVGVPAAGQRPATVRAPMPGLVVRVLVVPGQTVPAGASLVVLEAMKMENDLKAPAAGIVDQVRVAAGETVEKGVELVTFRPGSLT